MPAGSPPPRQMPLNMPSIFLAWLREKFPPTPRGCSGSAHDLEHVLYPTFLMAPVASPLMGKRLSVTCERLPTGVRKMGGRVLTGAGHRRSNDGGKLLAGPRCDWSR